MNKLIVSLIAAPAFMFVAASPASAQSRTWVSGVGDDLNPCSRTAPCKTFAGALTKTAAGGEINCLDPGGYGAVTIGKSITIDCGPYTHGSILSVGVNGVTINGVDIIVTLRGLSINGAATLTGNGVRIMNAAAVNIDDVVIENFLGTGTNGRGIRIETAGTIAVTIQNTRINNVNLIGIHSNPSGGLVSLSIDNTQISRAGTGMQFRQLTQAVVNRTSSTNSTAGFAAELGTVSTSLTNSNLSNNATGIINGNGGAPTTRLYATVITGNSTNGLQINTGQVISLGNNMIQGNAGGQTPSSTITTQ